MEYKSVLGVRKCEVCGLEKPAHEIRFKCKKWIALCEGCIEEGVRPLMMNEDQETNTGTDAGGNL